MPNRNIDGSRYDAEGYKRSAIPTWLEMPLPSEQAGAEAGRSDPPELVCVARGRFVTRDFLSILREDLDPLRISEL